MKVRILDRLGGLKVTPGGLHTALHGTAGGADATYQKLIEALRSSKAVAADETGWRIDAERGWLWTYVGDQVTVYDIAFGRGYIEAEKILGADFDGSWSATGGHRTASSPQRPTRRFWLTFCDVPRDDRRRDEPRADAHPP